MTTGAFDLMRAVREMSIPPRSPKLTPTDKLVLLMLALRADADGTSWPSHARICKDTWLSKRAVKTSIQRLSKAGIIEVRRRRHGDSAESDTNVYRVRLEVVRQAPQVGQQVPEVGPSLPHLMGGAPQGGAATAPGVVNGAPQGGAARAPEVFREVPRGSTDREAFALTGEIPPVTARTPKTTKLDGHDEVLEAFSAAYEKARGCKPEITAKDHVAVRKLLLNGKRPTSDAVAIVTRAFTTDFVRDRKPDLSYVAGNINSFLGTTPLKMNGGPVRAVQPVAPAGRDWKVGDGQ